MLQPLTLLPEGLPLGYGLLGVRFHIIKGDLCAVCAACDLM